MFSEFQSPGNHPVYFAVNTYQYGAPSSLSLSRPSPQRSLRQSLSPRIRILHVMGHDDGINLEPDQAVLAQLTQTSPKGWYPFIDKPHADVVSLRQPSYETLSQTLKDERGFDLFVYSGHSEAFYDQDLAAMLLAEKDGVTIAALQLAFQRAIAAGLKIAIFNSCASSQLAEVLLDYGISTVISMKEEVPDTVAHRFLDSFFQGYVQGGRSVLSAVKESLTALEEFDRLYPGVGWLPIIHQNPALSPTLWRELRQKPKSLRRLGTVAVGAIVLGVGLRFFGLTQGLDLKLFDVLVRTQPAVTSLDERLVVITINQDDLDILRQNGVQSSVGNDVISDGALADVLTKIQSYNPRWIGLDIARDVPIAATENDPLSSVLTNGDRLLLSCGFPDQQGDELLPPPGINLENLTFINLPVDPDEVIRRQLLVADDLDRSACPTTQSLAFSLALNYLAEEGITPNAGAMLTLNQKTFVPLGDRPGIYGGNQVGGYQILFRSYPKGRIPTIELSGLYSEQDHLDLKDKLVLLGYGHKDKHPTVFDRETPGVVIHAQMTKQILDAVLEDEPIYRFLPAWGEGVWILLWSGVGTGGLALILMGEGSRRQQQGLLIGLLLGATGSAWLALWGLGLWLPLSSPLLILGFLLGATLINDGDRH